MSRQAQLTAGPITAQLVRLCLPLLAANVLQQLYNIINSLVVTRCIGGDAFAALGVAESVMNLFIYVITGACMGASVLVARFFGEQNFARLRQQLFVSGVLIGGATAAGVLLTLAFLRPLLLLIQTPPELMEYAVSYLRIILAGMIFTFAYNYLAATLRAIGDTRAALCFLLASLAYNLAAAWLLVAKLELGIRREDMRMNGVLVRQTTSYAAVAALQQSSLYLGKLMIQSAVNGLGTAAISAFTATTRVENFSQAFGSSGCEAIAIFVAQNQGARKYRRALSGFLRGAAIVVGIGFLFSLLLFFGGGQLVLPFLDGEAESAALGASYLRLMGCFYFLSFMGHSYVGHYRGIGRMNVTFWGTTLQIAVRVVLTYALADAMGLDAVALATGLGWVAIVLFHSTVFLLELKGVGFRLPTRDEDGQPG